MSVPRSLAPEKAGQPFTAPAMCRPWLLRLLFTLWLVPITGFAAQKTSDYVRDQFAAAEKIYKEKPADTVAAWQFARACFDVAEYPTNTTERIALAERGITAARKAIAQDGKSAAAHYYLSMNLGQLARTRGIGALKLVDEMETEFNKALSLDPNFDHAGPYRNLGQLYRDAPSLLSVGSRSKARHHLQEAARLAPDFPENRLLLMESYLKWGDRNGATREFKALVELLPAAQERFSGPKWTASWADWNRRFMDARAKLEEGLPGLKSPRDE